MSKALAIYAFETLYSEIRNSKRHEFSEIALLFAESPLFPTSAPLFVTWNKNDDLRGCIGTFSPSPTVKCVSRYALISAFEDLRFSPIGADELPLLSVDITLLANFEEIADPLDWSIGRHGLKVQFHIGGSHYSGTFLPSVAPEQGWSQEDTLAHLLRKSGFRGPTSNASDFYIRSIKSGTMSLVRYEGLKAGATYAEYVQARAKLDN